MNIFRIFKRKRWEDLGESITANKLYAEIWQFNPPSVDLKDGEFQAIPFSDFMEIYNDYVIPVPKWRKDIWDCDNISVNRLSAIQLGWQDLSRGNKPLAFGYVEGKIESKVWHAFLWHRDDKGTFRFVEPQTGEVITKKITSFREFWAC